MDVDLKVKKGTFLSHWPASNERGGRLQWFKSDLSKAPPPQIPPSYLPETHWLQKLRDADSALYLKYESHFERFIAYDAELSLPIPVKIRGGPDEYTLQNLTGQRLLDVAVIVPTPDGYRVGWLDELPTAAPEDEKKRKRRNQDRRRQEEARKGEGRRVLQGRGKEEERRRAAALAGRGGRERQGQGRPAAQPSGRGDGRESPAARRARPDHRPGPAPLRARRPDAGAGRHQPRPDDEHERKRTSRPATPWPSCSATWA